jgi:hypothetical protein
MSSSTVNLTECETLLRDLDADTYSATVTFQLIVDGLNLGPCA